MYFVFIYVFSIYLCILYLFSVFCSLRVVLPDFTLSDMFYYFTLSYMWYVLLLCICNAIDSHFHSFIHCF